MSGYSSSKSKHIHIGKWRAQLASVLSLSLKKIDRELKIGQHEVLTPAENPLQHGTCVHAAVRRRIGFLAATTTL